MVLFRLDTQGLICWLGQPVRVDVETWGGPRRACPHATSEAHRPEGLDTGGARSSVVESDDYPVGSLFIAQQADGYDHVVIKTQPTAEGKQIDSIPNG